MIRRDLAGAAGLHRLKNGAVLAIDRNQLTAACLQGLQPASPPATTSASLLAKANRLPAWAAASVLAKPADPTTAATTVSTSGCEASSTKDSAPVARSSWQSGQKNQILLPFPDRWRQSTADAIGCVRDPSVQFRMRRKPNDTRDPHTGAHRSWPCQCCRSHRAPRQLILAGAGGGARSVSDLGEDGVLLRRDDQENRQIRCLQRRGVRLEFATLWGNTSEHLAQFLSNVFFLDLLLPPESGSYTLKQVVCCHRCATCRRRLPILFKPEACGFIRSDNFAPIFAGTKQTYGARHDDDR